MVHDTVIDVRRPEALMYEVRASGRLVCPNTEGHTH
jgi:hypothetical protein